MRTTAEIAEHVMWSILKSEIHTIKPAVITSVDYDNATVDAYPTSKTQYTDGTQIAENTALDVPILVISANAGNAKLSMPIAVGDLCFLVYSDRDYGQLLNTDGQSAVDSTSMNAFGRNPIGALCCFYTYADPTSIDDTNVVLLNGTSQMIIAPSGDVTIDGVNVTVNSSAKTVVNADGNVEVNTDGTLTTTSTGVTTINASALQINCNTTIAGSLGVANSSSGTASNVTITGTITVEGDIIGNADITISGDVTFDGDLDVVGDITADTITSEGDVNVGGSLVGG